MSKPLISLCLIVGNVSEYIERCLTSFCSIADEIIVVRAIGNQQPDDTLDIARDKFGARISRYHNRPGHENWPHVDNFAAARQQAFDMATGEFCFWCDTDDILLSGADLIREHAAKGEHDCYIFPYEIFGQHVTVPRERLVRKGSGRWVNPVHEFFQFDQEVAATRDDRIVIRHLPHLGKSGSVERNLRIMESLPESEMTPGMRYQLHCELLGAGRKHEAFLAAQRALQAGGLGKPETYQLLIHLATFSTDPHTTESYLIAAYQTDPTRREALGLLAGHAIDYGEPEKALSFARQMMATERPAESWNDRLNAYGWLGVEILQQALRANGRNEEAEKLRQGLLVNAGGAKISLIHATRGRAKRAATARKLWLDLAENPGAIEHIFVIDDDDQESIPLCRMHHVTIPAGGGCVAAWNAGAALSAGKVLIQMSDDWLPPPRWDTEILARLRDLEQPAVLAVSDGARTDQLLCMAIVTRKYYEQDWFLFHPDFTGVYSDNWFTSEAYRRGQVIEARDLEFKHDHPAFTGAPMDATYAAQNAAGRYEQGAAVFHRLESGTDWSSVPGFFNYWPLYKHIANKLQSGDVVAEIGVWMGRSIIYLAQECRRQGKDVSFVAVDTFRGEAGQPVHYQAVHENGGSIRALFEANLKRCGVADMVRVIEGDSAESAQLIENSSLAFCYIDAAHDYESVKRDITAWLPKVRAGGTLAGHDYGHAEVAQAVHEVLPDALGMSPIWVKEVA
jgi:hypothetical protein